MPETDEETERVRRTLRLGILSARCEEERAVLRCALNLLNGAEAFEIHPISGVAYTVAAFRRITPQWAEAHARYDDREDAESDYFRHQIVLDGRKVQASYAAAHPELAVPVWFPDHGPRSCVFCLFEANRAAGLPDETGLDPVTGRIIAAPEQVVLVTDPEQASTTATNRWERGTARFAGRDYAWQIGYQVRPGGSEHEFSAWAGTTVPPHLLALPRWERPDAAKDCHGGTGCCCVSIGHADRTWGVDWHLRWTDAAGDAVDRQWFDDGMRTSARDVITLMIRTGPWAERPVPAAEATGLSAPLRCREESDHAMSKETLEHLNTNTLIGFTEQRGHAWHYRAEHQGGEPNHYPGAIPIEDVRRRLFHWEAEQWNVLLEHPTTGKTVRATDRQAIVRSDTEALLGLFTDGYKPHPYNQWLLDNISLLLDDELRIGSAGLLKDGAVAWVQVEVPDSFHIDGTGVVFRPNLLAATSFNGSLSSTYKRGIINVVCDNTMAAGLAELGHQIKVKHSKNSLGNVIKARSALDLVVSAAADFEAEVRQLLATPVSPTEFSKFVDAWAPLPDKDADKGTITKAENKREQITGLYKADERVAPWNGTGWGVVQAVNTWAHHSQSVRGGTRADRNMLRAVNGEVDSLDTGTIKLLTKVLDRPLGQQRLYAIAA
ncbi:DUF932 domain-containing protein [Catenulispora sp. NF23]|uniref:DUF932 domain-containing protein n=1 Tax=Catenulispora pinistramenti TaxID=2705254 RepID=A0ABS5KKE4_9ACTN|nr:DUF932 domain-containing protein [Catenulispora pinistramenti]MBS2531947.1 DUF932 domain-containing protein [Catenulispora pinistramenti]MBS2546214.1 DUF932 domain-containing protein [Catenulispora pinistramenti]